MRESPKAQLPELAGRLGDFLFLPDSSCYNLIYRKQFNKDNINHIGIFKTKKDAAIAYNTKAVELFGSFANLNDVKD